MKSPILQLLVRWLVLAVGVTIATKLIDGLHCNDGATLLVVVVLLSFFNAILKPLLVLFTLPFIIMTMGLGMVLINAVLFLMVGELVRGFVVTGFWPAVGGAVIVSLTNFLAMLLFRGPPGPPRSGGGGGRKQRKVAGGDVIDI